MFGARQTANRRYVIRTVGISAVYVALNIGAIFGVFDGVEGTPGAWGVALAVAAAMGAQVWAMLRFIAESDEFVRMVSAKQFIVAAGVAMALFAAWGMGESYADAPHAPGWMILVLFYAAYGIAAPFIRTSR